MRSTRHQRFFTIDGVALGQSREEVDRLLGYPSTNANPCWARYKAQAEHPLLVSYRALWPQDPMGHWVVESLSGSHLREDGEVLAEVGTSVESLPSLLGMPGDRFEPEPGICCWDFSGCLVFFDERSRKVLEISLRAGAEIPGSEQAGAALAGTRTNLTTAC